VGFWPDDVFLLFCEWMEVGSPLSSQNFFGCRKKPFVDDFTSSNSELLKMYAQQNPIPQQHDTLSFYNSQFANGAHASNPNVAFTHNPAGATGVMQQKREFQGPPWGTGGYTDEGGLLQGNLRLQTGHSHRIGEIS